MAMRIVAESARLLGAPRLLPDRLGAYRRRALPRRFRHAVRRKAGRRRRARRGALDAQCRRARPHGLLARPAGGAGARHGAAHDGGLPQTRLRAELDLRALSGRASAGLWHAMSPGANPTRSSSAIRCSARAPTATATSSTSPARSPAARRTTASTDRRTAAPPSSSTFPPCPRPSSPRKSPGRFSAASTAARLATPSASSPASRTSGRRCAQGFRRGRRLIRSCRPVPHRRCHAGSAEPEGRARRPGAARQSSA